MFSQMSGQRLAVTSDGAVPLRDMLRRGVRGKPDVAALASLDENRLSVMVWHYHDDDVPGPEAKVELMIDGVLSGVREVQLQHFRIDHDYSNAYTLWQRMGQPQKPTAQQYAELEKAGQLTLWNHRAHVSVTRTVVCLSSFHSRDRGLAARSELGVGYQQGEEYEPPSITVRCRKPPVVCARVGPSHLGAGWPLGRGRHVQPGHFTGRSEPDDDQL